MGSGGLGCGWGLGWGLTLRLRGWSRVRLNQVVLCVICSVLQSGVQGSRSIRPGWCGRGSSGTPSLGGLVFQNLPCHCGPCCCYVASVMSNSERPHRRQPTRLRRPQDSLGKNPGVGCCFLLENCGPYGVLRGVPCVAQGTLLSVTWQPRCEGSLRKNGCTSVCG